MDDFIAQLLELARELQETAPTGTQDPREWMRKADDFADICMPGGQLATQLFTGISLNERGDFVRHVKAIKAAAGSYNAGLRGNIDSGLTFIVRVLNREMQVEAKPLFSFASIPELANKLTPIQKRLFDELWNHFVTSGTPFPRRSLPRIIGKQSIEEVFKGLNGSQIYETTEQGDRYFKLTLYGAFLTGHGTVLALLLIRLLDMVKQLYEGDTLIKAIDKTQIVKSLELSQAEAQLLFRLLNLGLPRGMPIYLGGWANDGHTWTVSITDDVVSLFRSDDTVAYLDERLAAGYRPDEPYSHDDRLRRDLQSGALLNPLPKVQNAEETSALPAWSPPVASPSRRPKVFIVHGRDQLPKHEVARFLERIGIEPIILHERPNGGRTLITKFQEESADIEFAIVIMTADDVGGLSGKAQNPRARQNVIFELGFFIGRLGAEKVCALVQGDVEKPSDFESIVYIPYSDGGGWKVDLARELSHAKVPFDAARVY